jgi:hypothetical protein
VTTLSNLIGTHASKPGEIAGYWERVPQFSLGGNDEVGDCVFCTAANYTDVMTAVNGNPELVPEAEVERWYAWETGWTRANPGSDKGEVLEKMLQVWRDRGNPSDPVDRLTGYCAIKPDEIHQAVHSLGAVPAWCMLPDDGGGSWDFSHYPLERNIKGTGPHAILIVESNPAGLKIVTWAEVVEVSHAWWRAYGKEQFAVRHTAWNVP